MQIWPAIDIRGGQCVRLRQGNYNQETVYGASAAEMAAHWIRLGAKRFHLVDLDGAKEGHPCNLSTLQAILEVTDGIPCEFGGGVRSEETIAELLEMGVSRLIVGTLALKSPDWFRQMCLKFPKKLVLGIDARNGKVAPEGWLETSETSAISLAKQFEDLPVAALVYTDIAKDGMMKGPNLTELKAVQEAVKIPLVASGGVTTIEDVKALAEAGMPACIIGRALYEETLTLPEAIAFE